MPHFSKTSTVTELAIIVRGEYSGKCTVTDV